jgi:8-oxo-dGTP diphosphatase
MDAKVKKVAEYLSEEEFVESFSIAPRIALVMSVRNKNNELLLVRRSQPPEEGKWSLPGAFLLKHETIADCLKRIAIEKIGIEVSKNDCRVSDVFEYLDDPRGHVVQVVYKYRLLRDILLKPWGESSEMSYFGTLPKESDIAFNHLVIMNR